MLTLFWKLISLSHQDYFIHCRAKREEGDLNQGKNLTTLGISTHSRNINIFVYLLPKRKMLIHVARPAVHIKYELWKVCLSVKLMYFLDMFSLWMIVTDDACVYFFLYTLIVFSCLQVCRYSNLGYTGYTGYVVLGERSNWLWKFCVTNCHWLISYRRM